MFNPVPRWHLSRSEQSQLSGLRKRIVTINGLTRRIDNVVISRLDGKVQYTNRTTRRFVSKADYEAMKDQRALLIEEAVSLYDKLDRNTKLRPAGRNSGVLDSIEIPAEVFAMMRKVHAAPRVEVTQDEAESEIQVEVK